MEHYKISRFVRISQMVTKRVTVITMSHYKVGICTFWSYWQIGSVFKVITTVFIVRIHHKKSSDLVIGFFLMTIRVPSFGFHLLNIRKWYSLISRFEHSRGTGGETLCWKVARIWQTICEVTRCLPNLLRWRPCLVSKILSLLESKNLVCGNILTNFCSFLFNIKIFLFTAEWFGKSNL